MPVLPLDLAAAVSGAVSGGATMYTAGLVAVPGDVLTAAACLLLGVLDAARGRAIAAMGWFLIVVSLVLFTVVDVVLGFVLPPLAASGAAAGTTGAQAFLAMKTFFNALFLASTAVFGGGAALAMLPHMSGAGEVPRALAAPAVIVGLIALAGGMAGLSGVSVDPKVLGVGIAGGALLFALVGLALARSQARAS